MSCAFIKVLLVYDYINSIFKIEIETNKKSGIVI